MEDLTVFELNEIYKSSGINITSNILKTRKSLRNLGFSKKEITEIENNNAN